MRSALPRILLPLAGLLVFYWGLFRSGGALPRPEDAPSSREAPLSAEVSRELASASQALYNKGQYAEALAPVLRLSRAYPRHHVYARQLANIYGALGQPKKEAEYWERFMVIAPEAADACPQIGKAYWKQDARREAVAAFERCLSFSPENPDFVFFMAWAYERTGQSDRARRLYERGCRISPGYADMHLGLARIQLREGHAEDARRAAATVLERSADNLDALLVMGLALQREGRNAEARRYLERGVALRETYSDFHIALGGLAEGERNFDEAMRHYQKVLKREPDNGEALAGRERVARRIG